MRSLPLAFHPRTDVMDQPMITATYGLCIVSTTIGETTAKQLMSLLRQAFRVL